MSDNQEPQAVVFDVGRVLIQWDLRHLFARLIEEPQELDWFLANVVTEEWHHQHDEGRPLDEMVPERCREFPDHAELIHAYRERFNETIPGQVPGMARIVERLKREGVPLFGLTNFGDEFWEGFRPTQAFFDDFADIVVSGREKCAKPDSAIYEIAEKRFGLPPQALLFTDDKQANIDAAAARGWQTHLFRDAATFELELLDRGLLSK